MVAVRQGQPTLSHGVEATGILTVDLVAVDGDLLASSLSVLILQECSAFWISSGIPIVVKKIPQAPYNHVLLQKFSSPSQGDKDDNSPTWKTL